MRSPYQILGVSTSATETDIKKAYRKLAKTYHPDRNKEDPKAKDKFSEVNLAYEILGDAEKRKQFDRGEIDAEGKPRFDGFAGGRRRSGPDDFEGFRGGAGPFGGSQFRHRTYTSGRNDDDAVFSQFFEQAFRGGDFNQPKRKGADLHAEITVTLEEIASEKKRHLKLPSGRNADVSLPRGVTDGQTVRLRGLGTVHPGQDPGDVLLTIHIAPHPVFKVEGADIRYTLPLEIEDAVLGTTARVPTLTGAVDMSIPPMTESGRTFRLRTKGLPAPNGYGDILVTTQIKLPAKADDALLAFAKARRAKRPQEG